MLKASRASSKAVGLRKLAFLALIHGSVAETLHTGRRSSASDAEVTVSSTGQTSVGGRNRMLRSEPAAGSLAEIERHLLEDPDLYQELRKQLEKDQASRDTNSSIEAVDCQWYDWSPWSFCTKSCGGGVSKRKRTVAVKETTGGHPCEGDEEDLGRCNDVDCPLDCQWGDWTSWSDCTASCDGGVRQREKPVILEESPRACLQPRRRCGSRRVQHAALLPRLRVVGLGGLGRMHCVLLRRPESK
ncbi:ADGRB3, partial [Symbiodinium microadriaticum]